MTSKARPPGPTWKSEGERPLKERFQEFAKGPIPLIRSRFEHYGDIYFIDDGKAGQFVLRHPDHIHEILVERGADFQKRSKDLAPFLGDGLISTSNGELWRRQRRLIQPSFRREKIEVYARTMVGRTHEMLARWRPGEVRDVGREMMELTLAVVAKTLFNHDTSRDADIVAKAMVALQDTTAVFDPLPKWVPTPLHLKRKRAVQALDDIIYPVIDAAVADSEADHLLGQLKHASDEEGRMSRTQLRDEIVTMFLAGHETTALAMTWVLYLLAQSADDERTLHEELDTVLGDRLPSYDDLPALTFTELCFKEALRMFPPIYIIPRVAIRDTKVAGFDVDDGAELIIWVYLCQRDVRWFPNPDTFIPGRWLPDTGGVKHAHAFLPFGAGTRQCVGGHFAMVEGTLMLASIAQRFRLRATGGPVQLNPRVTLGPTKPIMMELIARR